jgi:hypothetical protein
MSNNFKIMAILSFIWSYADIAHANYYYNRNGHEGQHAAWGGNGGSWGNPHSAFNEDYGWPDRAPKAYHSYYCGHVYYSNPPYPYSEQYSSQDIDGAALYFRIR